MCAEARLKSGTGSLAPEYDNLSAVIAAGVHLFPFRTEKLSPPAPMVLGGQPPGRVGRRRIRSRAAEAALLYGPIRGGLPLLRSGGRTARAPRRRDSRDLRVDWGALRRPSGRRDADRQASTARRPCLAARRAREE